MGVIRFDFSLALIYVQYCNVLSHPAALSQNKTDRQFVRWHWFAPALEKLRILNAVNYPPPDNCAWSGYSSVFGLGLAGRPDSPALVSPQPGLNAYLSKALSPPAPNGDL